MKKWLCLLLALVMLLSMAACKDDTSDRDEDDEQITSEESDQDQTEDTTAEEDSSQAVLGAWLVYIYMTEENTDGLLASDVGLPLEFTFFEDGTVTVGPHKQTAVSAVMALEADICETLVEMMYQEMEAEGYSREDVDEMFQDAYGMSLEEYAQSYVDEMNLNIAFLQMHVESQYEVDGDKLILDGEEMTFRIEGDELIIEDSTDPEYWPALGLECPVVMTRVED